MDHRERRSRGEYFLPSDPAIMEERARAQRLLHRYNHLDPDDMGGADALLTELLGSRGSFCRIVPPFFCDYGHAIHVGEGFFANTNFCVLDGARVEIGERAFIGPNVSIYTAHHPLLAHERNMIYEKSRPVSIGDDVWIGGSVSILGGVTIGSGSVIGAGSVVTRDIPAGVVAAGNPCRVIRPLSDSDSELPPELLGEATIPE